MRLPNYTIPSAFQLFDDTTHGPDKFANVRDMQKLRENHNILVARRVRRPIVTLRTSGGTSFSSYHDVRPPSTATAPTIVRLPVLLTQMTQKCRLVVYACKASLFDGESEFDFDPLIYPKLHPWHVQRDIYVNEKVTVSAAPSTFTKYSVDFPVPHTYDRQRCYYRGRLGFELCLYFKCAVDTSATGLLNSGVAIADVGPNWVEPGAALSNTTASIIYSDTSPDIPPRRIVKIDSGYGSFSRYYVDRPWDRQFAGADTLAQRQIQGLSVKSICVYELPITDLSPDAPGAG